MNVFETAKDIRNTIDLGSLPDVYSRLLITGAILIVLLGIRFLFNSLIVKKIKNIKTKYLWRKAGDYLLFFVGFLLIGRTWFVAVQSLATFVGIITAGLTIAMRELLIDLAGWLFILTRRPFNLGDRIEIGDLKGDVIDIRAFKFTLLEVENWVDGEQSTGRIVHVPNRDIFSKEIYNYTIGFRFIWNEVSIVITYESNYEKAKKIVEGIVGKHSANLPEKAEQKVIEAAQKFLVYYSSLTPIVYTKVIDYGVKLTMRYICSPKMRRITEHRIYEDVIKAFSKEDDIDFAYPTYRIFKNLEEGKEGLRKGGT